MRGGRGIAEGGLRLVLVWAGPGCTACVFVWSLCEELFLILHSETP